MDTKYKESCDLLINNYRMIKDEFRYDGNIINHFASMINLDTNEINPIKIKSIRKKIKDSTSRMSSFRGDVLYMISFLIGKENDENTFIEEVMETYEMLIDQGFDDCSNAILSSYAIVKNSNKADRDIIIRKMVGIYKAMELSYKDITNQDDYLECTLLALSGLDKDESVTYMRSRFDLLTKLNLFSKNSVQGFIMALLLNNSNPQYNLIEELLKDFKKHNIRICHNSLALLGVAAGNEEPESYVLKVKEVIEYICNEEPEYQYFMDKSFMTFIAIATIEKAEKREKYTDELISMVVELFIASRSQGNKSRRFA